MPPASFTPDTERLLDQAEAFCERRQLRLTDQRRLVLGLILDNPRPSGAYDLLDRLRVDGRPAAPPTVYRALEFLTAQGLVHKIERLSAFVGCSHMLDRCGPDHAHHGLDATQFLICTSCSRVFEMGDSRIRVAIDQAAAARGFRPKAATVEVEGVCADCVADAARAHPAAAVS
ncbi:Fur family transcriptional regulator [Acidisoma sp.]|uniref:Fur family transcriptional regulator n=1 Tax=Acidisoma sp. TaxID=1872115 RepID=UPI003AFFDC6A